MDAADLQVRNTTYRLFVSMGRAPTLHEVAAAEGRPVADAAASWARLHDAHALVLDESRRAIRMANPFSAVPTAHQVRAAGRSWYGNCAWDAFGICAALGTDGTITTTCADCGEPMTIEVRQQRPDDENILFHCLIPASHWWDDIAFT